MCTTPVEEEESAFAEHILDEGHQYGPLEQIMELIEYARKGNIMSIKENYYIYKFKQLKELIEEQKSTKENYNQNSMFDVALRHETRPYKRHRERGYKYPTQHTKNQCLSTQRNEK
jgi:hypothetical protein